MSDLISREAVIDWFRCYGHMDEPIPFETLVSDLRDAIPSADAAPVVHGRWIEKSYLLGTTRYCSECGENYGMPHGVFNYCPHCGAKMDGKEDGADHE